MSKASARPQSAKPQKTPKPVVPTADQLRAFFFLLRDLGWKPGFSHPFSSPMYPLPKDAKMLTKEMIETAKAFALEAGWRMCNDDEQTLLHNLRRTTYKGRNHVYETAESMRRYRPWIEGSAYNTEE